MEYIAAKTLVSKIKPSPFWFETDYNMNIYRGCSHGCIYCDSRSQCYSIQNFDAVKAKENAADIICRDLKSKRKKGVVATGAMSDPYNPAEKELLLTRKALSLINEFGFGLSLATKSPMVTRDIDILKEISCYADIIIKMTITASQDSLSKIIEPYAAPSSERFKAINALSQNGIFCGVLIMPVLPFITDTPENIAGIIKTAALNGANFVYPMFGVTLRDIQRDYFYSKLDIHFPGVKEKYIKTFGNSYQCLSPHAKELTALAAQTCKECGLLYKMPDIIKAYKKTSAHKHPTLFADGDF